jgi:hypothetical protein
MRRLAAGFSAMTLAWFAGRPTPSVAWLAIGSGASTA